MRTIKILLFGSLAITIILLACRQNSSDLILPVSKEQATLPSNSTNSALNARGESPSSGQCNPAAYTILLESHNLVNGNWEWTWSVQNPKPGNGNNGTVQDLSHWGMQFGTCFTWPSVVSAAYSPDGVSWTSFTPIYHPDPSQSCMTTPVLKFDFGTTGSAKSYYKLVVNQNYEMGKTAGYYKSGKNTGCCTFEFDGIGCDEGGIR